jgi:hypothetical protein
LLPGLVLGEGDDGEPFFALGRLDGRKAAATSSVERRGRRDRRSAPADFAVELPRVGALTVKGAAFEVLDQGAAIAIEGALETQQVVELIVGTGGFDLPGARTLVARTLGFTPASLPASVPLRLVGTTESNEGPAHE